MITQEQLDNMTYDQLIKWYGNILNARDNQLLDLSLKKLKGEINDISYDFSRAISYGLSEWLLIKIKKELKAREFADEAKKLING